MVVFFSQETSPSLNGGEGGGGDLKLKLKYAHVMQPIPLNAVKELCNVM